MTTITKHDSESDNEDNNNEEESEEESEEEESEEEFDIPSLLNHFFTNNDGENIVEVLTGFKKSLDTHNKLIYKLLASQSQKK